MTETTFHGDQAPLRKEGSTFLMVDTNGVVGILRTRGPTDELSDYWIEADYDPDTGTHYGWLPLGRSPRAQQLREAVDRKQPGIYEVH